MGAQFAYLTQHFFAFTWAQVYLGCGTAALVMSFCVLMLNTRAPPYARVSVDPSGTELERPSVGILEALRYGKVAIYSIICFFLKFSHYGYLFWLPYYMKNGLNFSDRSAVLILMLYDLGYLVGSFLTGYLSDLLPSRQAVLNGGILLATAFAVANQYWIDSGSVQFVLFPLLGMTVGGTLVLLTTACATDLGTEVEQTRGKKATATIVGIIEGCGSLGASLGQLAIGLLVALGWKAVFGALTAVVVGAAVSNFAGYLPVLRQMFRRGRNIQREKWVRM